MIVCRTRLAPNVLQPPTPWPASRALRLDEPFLQRLFERADIDPMPIGHHDQKCLERRIARGRDVFLDLANHPSLAAIEQLELAAKISDRADLLDKVAGLRRWTPAQAAHVRRQLSRIVAFVVADLLEHLAQLERMGQLGEIVQDAATGALGFSQQIEKSFELRIHWLASGPGRRGDQSIGTTGQYAALKIA